MIQSPNSSSVKSNNQNSDINDSGLNSDPFNFYDTSSFNKYSNISNNNQRFGSER
jgi:hypothetical protein